ncbi:MAG: TPR end-of-group domain-containing protein [Gemmatimonadota bacterium]
MERRLSAILAADVVGYSRLMGRDEEGTLSSLKEVRANIVDPEISKHNGRIVKTTGDGLLVEFPSVVDALKCAACVQKTMADRTADTPEDQRLQFRIGINLGDVIIDGDDIFGDGVNVAARLENLADPCGICISKGAWDLARGRIQIPFEDRGDVTVKNIAQPIRVYGIRFDSSRKPAPQAADAQMSKRSIAVLPFANWSSDPENEFFSDGISEELINLLTKLPELQVSSRTSSFGFKNKDANVRTIARELGVTNILEGSVRRAGKRIRITAQLIDADSDFHLWSETFDRELEDIFAVQDEIARSIVDALEVTLSPREERIIEKTPTADIKAYDCYLRGRLYFHDMRGNLKPALEMFSQAIKIDPEYALAHAGLADVSIFLYMWYEKDEEHLARADSASRRALELDPELAEGHAARGHLLSWKKRYDEAEREFETAMSLDPTLFEAPFFYARAAMMHGSYEKAAQMYERAAAVRPDDYQAPLLVTMVYRTLGREAEMEGASQRGLALVDRHLKLNPEDHRAFVLGATGCVVVGDTERALEWANRAFELAPENRTVLYNLACTYSIAGEPEKALDCLERSASVGPLSREYLEHDSDLNPIRGEPRFQALMAKL